MTTPQRITLMADLWPNACAATGWDENDRQLRLDVLGTALGRKIDSANEINHLTDFDAVKSHLLAVSQPANLEAQVRIANMQKTRAQYAIRKLDKQFIRGHDKSALSPYTRKIMSNRFGHEDLSRLTPEQLEQLRNTLAARKSATRRSKPDPSHQPNPSASPADNPY